MMFGFGFDFGFGLVFSVGNLFRTTSTWKYNCGSQKPLFCDFALTGFTNVIDRTHEENGTPTPTASYVLRQLKKSFPLKVVGVLFCLHIIRRVPAHPPTSSRTKREDSMMFCATYCKSLLSMACVLHLRTNAAKWMGIHDASWKVMMMC